MSVSLKFSATFGTKLITQSRLVFTGQTTLLKGNLSPSLQTFKNLSSYNTKSIMSFYDLKAKTNTGEEYCFSQLKGKVVLIVNTASQCGFTSQYGGLEALYKEKKEQGFEILGFPCNQFGGQEPGSNEEIASFCVKNHGVTFQLMEKIEVNGDNVHPVYEFLKNQKSGLLGLTRIKWNFEKFLINREGEVVERYASTTSPEGLKSDVEKYL